MRRLMPTTNSTARLVPNTRAENVSKCNCWVLEIAYARRHTGTDESETHLALRKVLVVDPVVFVASDQALTDGVLRVGVTFEGGGGGSGSGGGGCGGHGGFVPP